MAYISPAPGTASQVVLKVELSGTSGWTTALTVPGLQNITVNAANDVFTWSQLDTTAKQQVATTSTNSLGMSLVVDDATFFGTTLNAGQTDTVALQGLMGLSRNKTKIKFSLKMVENSSSDRYLSGVGYITGLAPTVSADSPVWVTPITITVSGEYAVAATES
jgi:hypothetical protein